MFGTGSRLSKEGSAHIQASLSLLKRCSLVDSRGFNEAPGDLKRFQG